LGEEEVRMHRAVLMLGVLLLAGCGGRTGPPVELVVTKGFTGTVWLMLDPDGLDIPLVDGRYRIVVPPDGVLRVRSHQPLEQWHSFFARYDDGTPIPWDHSGDAGFGPEVVAVRGSWAGVSHRGGRDYHYHLYFVGTAKQRSELPLMHNIPGAGR
jgi:hypothetical protein